MSGLFVILIPAGTLAALILFRWARTLALFLAAALVIWFVIHMSHARAQAIPAVQCRTGNLVQLTSGDVCDALLAGYRKIHPGPSAGQAQTGVMDCAKEIAAQLEPNYPNRFIGVCTQMWQSTVGGWTR